MSGHTHILRVRNVNDALWSFLRLLPKGDSPDWRLFTSRGTQKLEYNGLWITEYKRPNERVLFAKERDAHPFFHFMEALWILDGRDDVAWICRYLENLRKYSDDGVRFNAAYGFRMRHHFQSVNHIEEQSRVEFKQVDQLLGVIQHLKNDRDSLRAVMTYWDPATDLNLDSKDLPCNDMLAFKVRDGKLNISVMNRSNDAIWGAYGTNAVQFSFIAGALGVEVGTYRQISDSMHVYPENELCKRLRDLPPTLPSPYATNEVAAYPIMSGCDGEGYKEWLFNLTLFMEGRWNGTLLPFFKDVAFPIKKAWDIYKDSGGSQAAIGLAVEVLQSDCKATDWRRACIEWLLRRSK